jgi:small subunit ribosomal protein S15
VGLDTQVTQQILQDHKKHDADTGSSEVQISLLNARIKQLTEHLRTHVKDHHSRYGMFKLVGQQRRLLRYLYNTDAPRYRQLIQKLGLRDVISRRG